MQYKGLLSIVPPSLGNAGMNRHSVLVSSSILKTNSGVYNELSEAASRPDLNSIEATAWIGMAAAAAATALSGAVFVRVWLGGRGPATGPGGESSRAVVVASRFLRLVLAALILLAQLMYSRLVIGKGINVNKIVYGDDEVAVKWESPFLMFQWDALLLEASSIALPLLVYELFDSIDDGKKGSVGSILEAVGDEVGSRDSPAAHVMRFLLVKLMFMSGTVKILSNCPTWKGECPHFTFRFSTRLCTRRRIDDDDARCP